MRLRVLVVLPFVLTSSTFLYSQNQSPVSDARAVALATQSMAALTNGYAVSDATLTANAAFSAGSASDTGSATLRTKGLDESRRDLTLTSGGRTDVLTADNGFATRASDLLPAFVHLSMRQNPCVPSPVSGWMGVWGKGAGNRLLLHPISP